VAGLVLVVDRDLVVQEGISVADWALVAKEWDKTLGYKVLAAKEWDKVLAAKEWDKVLAAKDWDKALAVKDWDKALVVKDNYHFRVRVHFPVLVDKWLRLNQLASPATSESAGMTLSSKRYQIQTLRAY